MDLKINKFNNSKFYWYEIDSTIHIKRKLLETFDAILINIFLTPIVIYSTISYFLNDDSFINLLIPGGSIFQVIIINTMFLSFCIGLPILSILSLLWHPKVAIFSKDTITFFKYFRKHFYQYKDILEIKIENDKKSKYWQIRFHENILNLIFKTNVLKDYIITKVILKSSSTELEKFKEYLVSVVNERKLQQSI